MTVMIVAQPVNINIQCQHLKNAVARIAFTKGVKVAVSGFVHAEWPITVREVRENDKANETGEACNSLSKCCSVRGLVHRPPSCAPAPRWSRRVGSRPKPSKTKQEG
jgi:hypothetical protein